MKIQPSKNSLNQKTPKIEEEQMENYSRWMMNKATNMEVYIQIRQDQQRFLVAGVFLPGSYVVQTKYMLTSSGAVHCLIGSLRPTGKNVSWETGGEIIQRNLDLRT